MFEFEKRNPWQQLLLSINLFLPNKKELIVLQLKIQGLMQSNEGIRHRQMLVYKLHALNVEQSALQVCTQEQTHHYFLNYQLVLLG